MPHSNDMPMPVRRLQTSLEHAMFHRFPCWCLTHEDGTMQTDCSQGLMKMERLLKAEHIVWRKAELSWMHAGVIVDASPHFARPSRVSPMDRLPHKIAVHARAPNEVQSKIDVCCVQNVFCLFVETLFVKVTGSGPTLD